MKKTIALVVLAAFSAAAFSQNDPVTLGDAVPVDVHVQDADWNPNGHSLIYTRKDEDGQSLGAFMLDKYEGKSLLKLTQGQTYRITWLSGSDAAVVVVHGPSPDNPNAESKDKSIQIQMFVVDANLQSAKRILDETYDAKQLPAIDVDASPLLKHAIITMRLGKETRHLVITPGGDLLKSADLDRAEQEGLTGPTWSIDGTAIYSNAQFSGKTQYLVAKTGQAVQDSSGQQAKEITVRAVQGEALTAVAADSTALKLSIEFRRAVPMPETNSPVFELMPSNASLRPVRFRGPFESKPRNRPVLTPRTKSIVLQYEQSDAQDSSVWIKRGTEKNSPATLLAVHASRTWMSRDQNAVAYIIDGALFVRTIK
ncbi:MAG: hypothetical protein GC165_03480 [Armatimonadetes bacterium]|nr:hypothetical protein [Armatimonadota bacterium]